MCRRLEKKDYAEVLSLRKQNMYIKDIAAKFRVSEAQISNIINGKSTPQRLDRPQKKELSMHAPVPFKEEDFSQVPDHVLFRHEKACDFIG